MCSLQLTSCLHTDMLFSVFISKINNKEWIRVRLGKYSLYCKIKDFEILTATERCKISGEHQSGVHFERFGDLQSTSSRNYKIGNHIKERIFYYYD